MKTSINELTERLFDTTADAVAALHISGLKHYGKTADKRNKRNYNIYTDEHQGIDYHASFDIVDGGKTRISLQDVSDKL